MAIAGTRGGYRAVLAAGLAASLAFVALLWHVVGLESAKTEMQRKNLSTGTAEPYYFPNHPTLMTIGLGGGITQVALACVRLRRTTTHMVLQLVSLVCAFLGVAYVVLHKEQLGKPHLATWHAQLGALALGLALATTAVGSTMMLMWKLKLSARPAFLRSSVVRRLHLRMGAATQTAAAAAILLGMQSAYARGALRLLPFGDSVVVQPLASLLSLLPTASVLYYLWLRRQPKNE